MRSNSTPAPQNAPGSILPSLYRGRFAPSPTGPLHPGSLVAALGSWLLARRAGGEWLVRIEDIDPPREVAGASAGQLATLDALGLRSDAAVVWQGARGYLYEEALHSLLDAGHAFECRCTRGDLAAVGGIHRHCVPHPSGARPAIRLRVPAGTRIEFEDGLQGPQSQAVDEEVGDFVLRRADGLWAYQLAVVVDDARQGITDVVRGVDLLDSTPRQIFLRRRLQMPALRYLHLPLVLDAHGGKLGKSLGACSLDGRGLVAALLAAWTFLGQRPLDDARATRPGELLPRMCAAFDPARLPRTSRQPGAASGPAAGTLTDPYT